MFGWSCILGKKNRIQFVECPNDINGMVDCAKVADLAILLIDGSYGFEMVSETYTIDYHFSWLHCVLICLILRKPLSSSI